MSSQLSTSEIIAQLALVFNQQHEFLSTEDFYEKMDLWQDLSEAWDALAESLSNHLQQKQFSAEEREQVQKLVFSHNDLCHRMEKEMAELQVEIGQFQKTRMVRKQYEDHYDQPSIFYDTKK
ncbi:hypothetical protein [Paenibacillus alginolyticus]|uniref:Flagellar protein FliT n=1 Tax=Paenibacillus alginolyticus TaxID=59839 RepID=A0ABT4GIV9_9BACL|nr:hypothetical protein [Paenibacillus alginolyticus]MCY9696127.1 hypothetical protein [Paenibacillus alginolyticus]MEC0143011.1 hypothetical protein [Paenibacillus alginolyticus]